MRKYIYLASPYSHEKSDIRQLRYCAIEKIAAQLFREGIPVFSPIIHCHYITIYNAMPTDADFWRFYNRTMLQGAEELWLLLLDGHKTSKGMKGEKDMAVDLGIPIQWVEPDDENIRQLAQRVRRLYKPQRST